MPAGEFTEADFPCTPAGHRRLLARANYYRNLAKVAFARRIEDLREQQDAFTGIRDALRGASGAAKEPGADLTEVLDTTLKKSQQLIQELGRHCVCCVCTEDVKTAEMNREHREFMHLLYCSHIICGGCAHGINQTDNKRCPECRADIASQIRAAVPTNEDAQSNLRPQREQADLAMQPTASGEGFHTRYAGTCYVCDSSWVAGATVAKHRRVQTKLCCVGCMTSEMPCAICGKDTSETEVLRNGKAESKRFFCKPCVRQKQEQGETKGIIGATQFLKRSST